MTEFTLNNVYPWGRTLDEYACMFALTDDDLRGRVLCAADGPASFNAELTARQRRQRQGGSVTSVDPLYRFTADDIRARVRATADKMVDLVIANAHRFVWDRIASPEALRELRLGAMEAFLTDFPAGLTERRYIDASLPRLDFPDDAFDLALCSHFLFLYSADFGVDFHVAAMCELLRLAPDVRVFPLLDMEGKPSAHLPAVTAALRGLGHAVSIDPVPYEFQRGGNTMLRVRRRSPLP